MAASSGEAIRLRFEGGDVDVVKINMLSSISPLIPNRNLTSSKGDQATGLWTDFQSDLNTAALSTGDEVFEELIGYLFLASLHLRPGCS